jgi:CRP/FNR family transcriptional regulator, cyclic AMP receptor protein
MTVSTPDALRTFGFFSGLSDDAFAMVSQSCHRKSFGAQELIIGHKDESFDVLFLLSGQARVNIYSASGRRVSFRDITEGAIFGELSAIDGEPRSASVESVGPCMAAIMPQRAFRQALSDHPAFMLAVITHLTKQVRALTARVVEFSTLAVRNRVQAEILRRAGDVPAKAKEATISPAPTHAEIASHISTHREAVTRELSWLEDQGIIVKEGRTLRIKDLAKLRQMAAEFPEE